MTDKPSLFRKFKSLFRSKEDSDVREAISELIAEDETDHQSSLNEEERELFSNILELQDLTVEDIMVPRADIIGLPLNISKEDFLKTIQDCYFSRYPVFNEDLDDIRGFVHIKDVLLADHNGKAFDVRPAISRAIYVPTSMPVIDLLSKMRSEQSPLAIVVDEYGGTDGLITAWDILMEIMGEMAHDPAGDDQAKIVPNNDGSYTVDARLEMDELESVCEETFMTPDMEEEVDTVGGLVMYLAGRVPDRKEIIDHPNGYEFEVIEATPRSLLVIRVSKKEKPE